MIQNLDNRTCLAYDPTAGASPQERLCDIDDKAQFFTFDVQTYVGGIGFVYKVCSVDDPSFCLMHESSGAAEFIDQEQVPSLVGTWYDQVRIQHDEDDAFIEFRYSGKCLTAGTPPSVGKCDWFGSSPQHYRLLRPCSAWNQDCDDGHKCAPYATLGDGDWDMNRCVLEDPAPGQPGDPCTVDESGSGEDTCDVASSCFYVSPDSGEGICVANCTGSPNAPACDNPTTSCADPDGVAPLCLPTCHPLLQSCDGADQTCAFASSGDAFVCLPDTANGNGVYGAACSSDEACNPGLFCGAQSTVPGCTNPDGCCSEFCDLDVFSPSGACTGVVNGQTCQPWFDSTNTPPGYEDLGFCGIP